MFKTIEITPQSTDFDKVRNLYLEAFPENERGPFELLFDDGLKCSEVLAFYESDEFCGFVSVLTHGDISHILYFAMDESKRGMGHGTRALESIKYIKQKHRIIADIEAISLRATNNVQRERRKRFYLNNGFVDSDVMYDWENDSYEILVYGGAISSGEFWDFWDAVSEMNSNFAKF